MRGPGTPVFPRSGRVNLFTARYTDGMDVNPMKHRMVLVLAAVISLSAVVFADSNPVTSTPKTHRAVTPVARSNDWWIERHEAIKERIKQGNVNLIFIGDSITHSWETSPTHAWENNGAEIWTQYYAPRNAVNLGYSGDRTENVLWRLENGEIDGISPKLAVLMIGSNNSNNDDYTVKEIADGIIAIIEKLRTKLIETKVLVLGIFPRSEKPCPQREKNAKASALAAQYIAAENAKGNQWLSYLDLGSKFLTPDGTLPQEIFPDFLHPNAKGYQIWAETMEPTITELMGETNIQSQETKK